MPSPQYGPGPHENGAFRTTRWSVVIAAASGESAVAHAALSSLCQAYWYPLYLFIRRSGRPSEEAKDLTQAFFERVLERGAVAEAAEERGRFRSFLLSRLKYFLIDEWRHAHRQKRGGAETLLSVDDPATQLRVSRELAEEHTPATLFDRAWATTLFDRAVKRVAAECDGDGKRGRFAVLKGFLIGSRGETPLQEAAARLGISLPAAKSVVHRLRERFAEVLRQEISDTLGPGENVEEELRWLLTTLTSP